MTEPRKLTTASVLGITACGACWLMWVVADAGFDRYHLPKELWLSVLSFVCALRLARSPHAWTWDRIQQLTLVSLAIAALATLLATTPELAVRPFTLELAVVMTFLAARTLRTDELAYVLAWCVVGALGVAMVAWAEAFGLFAELSRRGRTPGATLGQRNSVGHLMALAGPAAWYLALALRSRTARGLACGATALFSSTLLITRSRAAWLASAVALLVYVCAAALATRSSHARWSHARWALPAASALTAFLLATLVPTRLAWTSPTPYADTARSLFDAEHGSGAGRLAQYRATMGLVALHPLLGAGPGNWMVEYPRVDPAADSASRRTSFHTGRLANSDWLALWCEQGSAALLVALWLGLQLVRSARGDRRLLTLPLLAALVVAGSLDAVMQLPASACLAALLLGAAASAEAEAMRPAPRAVVYGLALLLAAGSWAACSRVIALFHRTRPGGGYAAAERAVSSHGADLAARLSLAEAYALSGDCERARRHLAVLERLLPYHHIARELGCATP